MLKSSRKLIAITLLALAINGLFATHSIKQFEYIKGYALARYDLHIKNPKIYIYGFVHENLARKEWEPRGIHPVFRGCIVGELQYMDEAYNKEVRKELGIN